MGQSNNSRRIFGLALCACFLLTFAQCSGRKSDVAGITDGKLAQCPDSPNCVSSQSEDPSHFVEPLRYNGSLLAAKKKLSRLLASIGRVEMITEEKNYFHVTFTSGVFRFVDDVEFYFVDGAPLIHVRSASRLGYYDLGANRRRIEKIRKAFVSID
jgi:uncharacterized protein (DUF1499 family)